MPKRGAAHPVTPEWQEAVKLRLQNGHKSYTWLASQVGVTRAAITHLLTKAAQSSLVPLEKALKLKPKDERTFYERTQEAAPTLFPTHDELVRQIGDTLEKVFGPPDARELMATFMDLRKPEHRQRVIGFVRALWETEQAARSEDDKAKPPPWPPEG